ncbi:hypothetical protein C8A03DRAFT_30748 [Achaetomium macrosporum]|uniref:Uncharacterized protein n=1 Tax=Achaetomium macrosporum TaxID=79813 RepID=A0AAN7HHV7_9PEZI|nr:hypothetical protein C8A03DRAFT_30748 [Achaetomium macrosporum]
MISDIRLHQTRTSISFSRLPLASISTEQNLDIVELDIQSRVTVVSATVTTTVTATVAASAGDPFARSNNAAAWTAAAGTLLGVLVTILFQVGWRRIFGRRKGAAIVAEHKAKDAEHAADKAAVQNAAEKAARAAAAAMAERMQGDGSCNLGAIFLALEDATAAGKAAVLGPRSEEEEPEGLGVGEAAGGPWEGEGAGGSGGEEGLEGGAKGKLARVRRKESGPRALDDFAGAQVIRCAV